MTNTVKFLFASALAVASANAATITYNSGTISDTPTNWSSSLGLQEFNPTLGTLNSITFTLNGDVSGSVKVENTGSSAATVNSALAATLTLERPDTTQLVVVLPKATFTDSLSAFDGTIDFGGTSGVTHSGISASTSQVSATLTDATDLALFKGTGILSLPAVAVGSSAANGGGNLVAQFISDAGASASVTYDYTPGTPATTPEPSSMALMGLGLGAAGLIGRKKLDARK